MSTVLQQLKAIRIAHNIKQAELGKKLGLPQSHISKIEQEATDPRLSTVMEMARVLDQELVLIPRELRPHIHSLLHGETQERRFQPDEEDEG